MQDEWRAVQTPIMTRYFVIPSLPWNVLYDAYARTLIGRDEV
jgi:hypothetical protein